MLPLFVSSLLATAPVVGAVAPDFTVKDVDGVTLTLSTMVTKGPVVLAFFPKAFTGGCTRELNAYRDQHPDIQRHGGTVVAISADNLDTQKRFRDSLKAPYHFVADDQLTLTKLFDVKGFLLPLSKRITFVVGAERKILSIQEGNEAINPAGAVAACSIEPAEALKYVTGEKSDAGVIGPVQK